MCRPLEMLMSLLEKTLKCPHCRWEGSRTSEKLNPQFTLEELTVAVGPCSQETICPKCNAETTPRWFLWFPVLSK